MLKSRSCIWCNVVIAVICSTIVSPLVWWGMDRQIAYNAFNGRAIPNPASPEDTVDVVWGDLIVYREGCHGTYQREIVDSTGHIFTFKPQETTFGNQPKGTHKNIHSVVPWRIPKGASIGRATLKSRIEMHCNPVHKLWPVRYIIGDVHLMIER